MRIEYSRGDAYGMAWAAIDRSEALDIVIRGWRVGLAKRALPLCEIFSVPSERPRRAPRHLLAMAVYGWALSPLVGLYNHAMFSEMRATWQETEGAIVVSFRSHNNPAGT